MTNFVTALAEAQRNYTAFGYLALMAAIGLWWCHSLRPVPINTIQLPSFKLPPATIPLLLFGGSFAIRLIGLDTESLWYDEAVTAAMARQPLDQMIVATVYDIHPPAFYIFEWVAVRAWGANEFGLRLLPALCSAGAVVLVYALASDHLRQSGALLAAALAAALPGPLYYGQEARSYSMLALWLLLALWASRRRWWPVTTLSLALALYSHYYAALYIAAFCAYELVMEREQHGRLLSAATALFLFIPWLAVAGRHLLTVSAGYWLWPPTPGRALAEPLLATLIGYRLPAPLTLLALAAALLLTVAGLRAALSAKSTIAADDLIFLALTPALLALLASAIVGPVLLARGLLPSAYLLIVVWALWLSQHWTPTVRTLAVAALIVGVLYHYNPASNARDDVRAAARTLDLEAGAVVYHTDEESLLLLAYYAPQATHQLAQLPAGLAYGLTAETRAALGIVEVSEPAGRYLVVSTGISRSSEQYALTADIKPEADPLVTLYDSANHWGAVYDLFSN